MAIGERIRFFRNLKGMTQKYLGMQVGFPASGRAWKWFQRLPVGQIGRCSWRLAF